MDCWRSNIFFQKFLSNSTSLIDAIGNLSVVVVGTTLPLWLSIRLKRVRIDYIDDIYVSNYIKETKVPLREIKEISRIPWVVPDVVAIELTRSFGLGRKFWFIASPIRYGVDIFTFSDHPIIDELRNLMIMSRMKNRNGKVEDED